MIEDIINDYVNNFIGVMELSVKYKLNRITIQRYLIKSGVKLRKKTPKYKVNHHFFSEYNEKSCYWAGFILADGYIRDNNRFTLEIKLQKQDVNHLYKFKEDIEYEGKVIERDKYYSITISSSKIVGDLAELFEIHNKKSLTCRFSNKIPIECIKHYIRGYFDGDGCISRSTINYISFLGTKDTVNYIREYFYNNVNVTLRSKNMPNICRCGNIFTINYSGNSAIICLHHIYNGSTIYLDRKYYKYLDIIKV